MVDSVGRHAWVGCRFPGAAADLGTRVAASGELVAAPSAWRAVAVWDLAVGSTVAAAWEASMAVVWLAADVAKPKALPCLTGTK